MFGTCGPRSHFVEGECLQNEVTLAQAPGLAVERSLSKAFATVVLPVGHVLSV